MSGLLACIAVVYSAQSLG